ncbi:MAG: PAS domain S-box protein, partial [Methanomicrobiales archaeon]
VQKRLLYTPEELAGSDVLLLHVPERRDEALRNVQGMIAGTVDSCPVPVLAKDGTRIEVETKITRGFWNGSEVLIGVTRDITERKVAEEEIKRQEALIRSLLDSIPDIIFFKNIDGVYLGCNPPFAEFVGRTRDEIIGKTDYDLFDKEIADFFREQDKRMLELGQPRHNEEWITYPDGRKILIDTLKTPYWGPDGILIGVLGISRDITERKTIEEALRESKVRVDQLAEQSRIIAWEVDPQGLFTYVSHVSESVWGYRPEELVGRMHFYDLHPEPEREAFKTTCLETFERKEHFQNLVNATLAKDGHIVWVSTNGIPLLKADDTLRGYRGSDTDITERKKAEEALRESEARFHSMFERHDSVMLQIEPETGKIIDANLAAEQFYGISRKELCTKSIEDINTLSKAEIDAEMMRAVKEQKNFFTFPHRLANDEIRTVEVHSSPIGLGGKTVLFSIIHDITERKQIEEKLRQSEILLRSMIESPQSVIIFSLDRNYRYLAFNATHQKTMKAIWGVDIIPGMNMLEVIGYENDRNNAQRSFDRALSGEHFTQIEEYGDEGLSRNVWEDTYSPIYDENHQIIGLTAYVIDITERKREEDKLLQLSDRLSLATRAGGVGIWDYDVVNNTLSWDDQMFALYGITREQFGGAYEAWQAGLYPDDRSSGDEEIQQALSGEKEFNTEFRVLWPNGSVRNIRAVALVQRDAAGKPLRMIGTNWDITEQKKAEEVIRESEEQIRLLLDSTAEAIYGLDIHGNCTFCNNSCLRLLGYKNPEELLGKNMHWLIHQKYPDGTHFPVEECRIFKAFNNGVGTHVDDEVLWRSDGTSFPAEYWSYPQRRFGVVVGAVVTFLDITARKNAEMVLQQSEEKYRLLIKNSHDIIYTINREGILTFVSAGWTALLGQPVTEVTGRPFQQFVHPDDIAVCSALMQKVIDTGQRQTGVVYRVRHADGSWRWHTTNAVPLKNEAGTVVAFEGSASDITERKHAEDAVLAANKKLNILNSVTRHDVLNQITALVMLLEIVGESVTDKETIDF